jgi:integrase
MAYLKTRHRADGQQSYVVCWTDFAGRECQRTYRSKTAAGRALRERVAQEARDELPDEAASRERFATVAQSWLSATRRRVKFRTADGYEELLRTRILPAFGERRIGSITSREIEAWLGSLVDSGLSTKTARNAYTPLVATFKYAQRHNMIRSNPCAGVDLPATPDQAEFEGQPLTRIQVAALAAELDCHEPYGLAGRLLAAVGLRAAEFAGLRIGDLDLDRGTVSVTRTLTRDRKADRWIIGTPKSRRGRREVPILDEVLLADLRNYVRDHPRADDLDAPLFYGRAIGGHSPDPSKPLDGHVFYQWHLKPAARKIGLPHLRVHDLRHTAATLWHDDGIPLSVISRWLGHASVAVTDRVYVHLRPNDDYARWRERYRTAREAEAESRLDRKNSGRQR